VNWLARYDFSSEWQEAFRLLNVHGAEFLEIGQSSANRSASQRLRNQILPKVLELYGPNADDAREVAQASKLYRMVRTIVKVGGETPQTPPANVSTQDHSSTKAESTAGKSPKTGARKLTNPPNGTPTPQQNSSTTTIASQPASRNNQTRQQTLEETFDHPSSSSEALHRPWLDQQSNSPARSDASYTNYFNRSNKDLESPIAPPSPSSLASQFRRPFAQHSRQDSQSSVNSGGYSRGHGMGIRPGTGGQEVQKDKGGYGSAFLSRILRKDRRWHEGVSTCSWKKIK
jgi:mitogen-activated protein kinase kinase kinase